MTSKLLSQSLGHIVKTQIYGSNRWGMRFMIGQHGGHRIISANMPPSTIRNYQKNRGISTVSFAGVDETIYGELFDIL